MIEVFGTASEQTVTLLTGKQEQYEYYAAGNSAQHFLNDGLTWDFNQGYSTLGYVRLRDILFTTTSGTSNRYYDIGLDGRKRLTDIKESSAMGYMQAPIFFV